MIVLDALAAVSVHFLSKAKRRIVLELTVIGGGNWPK